METHARLILDMLRVAGVIAVLPATGAVAGDRDAAALFARVCIADVPAFMRVQNSARSEGWIDAPPDRGRPKPARLEGWLVPVGGKVGFVVSVSTVITKDQIIEQCTVGGPAVRQAVLSLLRSVHAEEQPAMTGDMVPGGIEGNPLVYVARMGGNLAYITTQTPRGAYVLSITIPHDKKVAPGA